MDRDPAVALPQKVYYAERQYGRTVAGDEIRARHRERAEARQRGEKAFQQVLQMQKEDRRRAVARRVPTQSVRRGALNKDELNALRRQSYSENKVAINDRRRESQRKLIRTNDNTLKSRLELRREKRRQQIQAMSEEQREAERAKARQQYRNRVANAEKRPPTAEDSVRDWLEYRKSHGPGPTAEQSAQGWLAYRQAQGTSGTSTLEDEQNSTQWQNDRGLSL